MKKSLLWGLAILVIFLDQISKQWILHNYTPYLPEPITNFFSITLAFNTGAAFSILSGPAKWHAWFFIIFSLLMIFLLSMFLARTKANEYPLGIGFSLILGGAVSNFIDRLNLGQVVDFLDVHYKTHHWPVFNVADSAICVGAFWLFIFMQKK
ncbi:MAG: signal peptidase II [Legionellales bacterium RIFCSPHIGHO2_12_FULL_37_14]|nr:MAG: signal peptidase II [Legionellales bacterium RIFCSPHIGHO2_12_FULL_37_14]